MSEKIKKLYRFMSADSAIKTIESKSFRVGRIVDFNDPFECLPGIINYKVDFDRAVVSFQNFIQTTYSSLFGVVCLSETFEDSVLWSHYADHHRGVALELDVILRSNVFPVTYDGKRPILDLSKFNSPEKDFHLKELADQIFSHKSPGWSYEKEYRAIVDLRECKVRGGAYYLDIQPDLIQRVLLGMRCPIDEGYFRRCLDQSGFTKVKVARAVDDKKTYKISVNLN